MKIAIAGAGNVGTFIAEDLQQAGHDVLLIEQDFDLAMYYYAMALHHGYMWFLVNDPVWQSIKFNTANNSRFCAAMVDNRTRELLDAAIAGHVPPGAVAAFETGT